jgi:nickel superoxide dismutase
MVLAASGFCLIALSGWAHCEVPCGIYDDALRCKLIEEHLSTIQKSMEQIAALSQEKTPNWNQIVRWVRNKEEHADRIQEIVSQYFMTQRIKPVDAKDLKVYGDHVHKLVLLHEMLVYAMKAKQTTEAAHVEKARSLLVDFQEAYFSPQDQEHLQEHNK